MKILFCASSYKIGLTSLFTEHMIALNQQKEVDLYAVFGEGEQHPGLIDQLKKHNIKYKIIPGFDEHSNRKFLVQQLKNIITDFSPDIAITQTNWQFILIRLALFFSEHKFKTVYWVHGFRNNHRFWSLIALALIGLMLRFFSDLVIVSSKPVEKKFRVFLPKHRLLYSSLGVDNIFFQKKNFKKLVKNKKIIFTAQFREGKNQKWIINALAMYIKKHNDMSVQLILPGEGELLNETKKYAASCGIADNVVFPGQLNRSEIAAAYSNAYFAVVPTSDETFGSCIAEPFVCGIPVLTRPVGCAVDLIKDKKTGFIFNTKKELEVYLEELLNNESLCSIVSKNCLKERHMLAWNSICKKYIADLKSCYRCK